MVKKGQKAVSKIVSFLAWFTGIVVSLAVSFGLVNGTLILPTWLGGQTAIGVIITQAVGWIVLITTLVGAILAILER